MVAHNIMIQVMERVYPATDTATPQMAYWIHLLILLFSLLPHNSRTESEQTKIGQHKHLDSDSKKIRPFDRVFSLLS